MINKDEQGRTMLEMLGVLAIMGIIVYGAIAGINYGMDSYKITQVFNEIQEIARGVEDLYSWSKNYQSISISALCKNDVFPDGCLSGNEKALGQFGGEIGVYPFDEYNNFKITYYLGENEESAQSIHARLASLDWQKSGLCQKLCNTILVVWPMQDNCTDVSGICS